jgi:protein-S-isoprenylcysteine O-methyltransferase Ste14
MSTQIAALFAAVLYGVGLVMLFVIRSLQHKASTGSTGFNGFTKTPELAPRLAGICFATAAVIGLVAPTLTAVQFVPVLSDTANWTPGLRTTVAGVGVVLAVVGFVVAVIAQATMGRSWRIGVDVSERTDLVTHGVFGLVRNPIFSAMIAAQLGTTLMAPSWLSIVGAVGLLVACQVQVRVIEEPYLIDTHGPEYLRYAARTGRFLPGLGRITPTHGATETRSERVS